jgi:hypothetical protein
MGAEELYWSKNTAFESKGWNRVFHRVVHRLFTIQWKVERGEKRE